jgi:putative glutamine amidotransferase
VSDPVVGITTAELFTPGQTTPAPESEPPQRKLSLGMDYPTAVGAAGGVPVVLPPNAPAGATLLDRLDALVISGGPDIDPALYGAVPHPQLGPVEHDADPRELEILVAALERGMPVLAICRGMQMLNVARGGTLWQDLPSERPSDAGIRHRQSEPGSHVTHEVTVEPDSVLARLTGRTPADDVLEVNSFHHQAVRELGDGLRIVARAPDGVVEAVEDATRPFLVGVQWHAESLAGRHVHGGLFRGLVAAARGAAVGA